jgi:short-chain Z-isoprenyl diphosphate synthase
VGDGLGLDELAEHITPAAIDQHLYTARLPDPGLIIRTSGGVRLSGFLLWQCINSEFYFTHVYWPEFREVDFLPRFARSSRGRDALGSEAGDQIKALEPR